jgi:hypothetical protein
MLGHLVHASVYVGLRKRKTVSIPGLRRHASVK